MDANQQQGQTEDTEQVSKVIAMHRLLLFNGKRMTYVEARQTIFEIHGSKVLEPDNLITPGNPTVARPIQSIAARIN